MGRCSIPCGRWGRVKIQIPSPRIYSDLHGLNFFDSFPFSDHSFLLFAFHGVDQLEELGAIDYLDERLALGFVADHINGRCVIDTDALAQILVLSNSFRQLTLGIDRERQINFVICGEFLCEGAQGWRRDLRLVLKNVVAEFVPELFGVRIEITRYQGGVVRPVVHREREVVADDGNLVSSCSFFDEGRGAAAVGALQVFEDNESNLGAFRRAECRIDVLGWGHRGDQQESHREEEVWVSHILLDAFFSSLC
jgi:hypothetical protein